MLDLKNDESFVKHFSDLGLENGIQIPLLEMIIFHPERVVFIPKEDYDFIWEVLLENEYYEYLPKLLNIKSKIKDISLCHFKTYT